MINLYYHYAEIELRYCIRHGGGKRCTYPGCHTAARGRTGLCYRHKEGYNGASVDTAMTSSKATDSLISRLLRDIDRSTEYAPSEFSTVASEVTVDSSTPELLQEQGDSTTCSADLYYSCCLPGSSATAPVVPMVYHL